MHVHSWELLIIFHISYREKVHRSMEDTDRERKERGGRERERGKDRHDVMRLRQWLRILSN